MAHPYIEVTVLGSEIVGCGNVEISGSGFSPHANVSVRGTGSVVPVGSPWHTTVKANSKDDFYFTISYGTPGDGCVAPSPAPEGTLKIDAKDTKGSKASTVVAVQNCWMLLGQECF
jgi:hypothetical protein